MSVTMDRAHFDWPFFDAPHRAMSADADRWALGALQRLKTEAEIRGSNGPGPQNDYVEANVDAICRRHVASLGAAGLLRHCVPARFGGASARIDSRALCALRESLAWHDGLADFAFAMQGPGAAPIALAIEGNDHPAAAWLAEVAQGRAIAAFALSEPDAGSDVAAMTSHAVRDGNGFVIDGCKTWISNGGIADFYCVFARTGDEPGTRGISAFVVPASTPGLTVSQRIEVIAPHPLARLEFDGCRVPADALLGNPGEGFKLAMRTLDIFRASVGAAAVGFARRALDESIAYAQTRRMFGERSASATSRARCWARWRRTSMRQRCSSIARPGGATSSTGARPRRRRWRSSSPPNRHSGSSTTRFSCMARGVSRAASASNDCIARSARCASTKARRKCSDW
jgi:alkylation response protein AidB-like acyl-CoA dehydrogenase